MNHGAYFGGDKMVERKRYDPGLVRVGELITQKRRALGYPYNTREKFIAQTSKDIFGGKEWMSVRHLANLELGKNWISIEKFIILADALQQEPVSLFKEFIDTYRNENS